MLPRVIVYSGLSVDGRVDWFCGDMGLYYEVAARWTVDAVLCGSATILKAFPPDAAERIAPPLEPPILDPQDTRPLMVVVDSCGQLSNLYALRAYPYWRDVVALCSQLTPAAYLNHLRQTHVSSIIAGEERVDLRAALEALNGRYNVRSVRVDSGGILNGVLLRAGLVDEVSVLIYPYAVGGRSPRSMFVAPDLKTDEGVIRLRLACMDKVRDDAVWLRYEVVKP